MRNIIIKELIQKPIEEQEVEIVERKGIGHPDSISDGIAESVSRALCQAYMEKFGGISCTITLMKCRSPQENLTHTSGAGK